MPFVPSFSAQQSYSTPSKVTLTDASTGSDGAIAERRVTVQDYQSTYLKETGQSANYKVWSIASSTVTLDLFQRDTAVKITVTYVNSSGTTLYTATVYRACDINSQIGKYSVLQKWVSNPAIINDVNYLTGLQQLCTYLEGATDAITAGANLFLSQQCLDGAKMMLDHQETYF